VNENLEPYEYKELPIESVEEDKEAEIRVYYDVSDLVESIRAIGQLAPGYAYKDGDKYKVFVGIRRLRAIKELYAKEGKPNIFKAFVFEKKPKNFYEFIRDENVKRSDLTGLDKVHIILNFPFAEKILSSFDIRFINPVRKTIEGNAKKDIEELALEEQRVKAKGHENHLSLPEILFLFNLHSLEERKFFAIFFLVYRINLKRIDNFKEFAVENVSLLKPEDLEIAGLSKEDVEKIIAMYQAPPYQAEIIQEEFEEKKEKQPEEKLEKTEETPLPESTEEQPLEIEKSEEQPKEVEKLENEEAPSEAEEKERIIIMLIEHEVEYGNFNGERIVLIKKESGIRAIYIEDGQELEINGVKARIKYK